MVRHRYFSYFDFENNARIDCSVTTEKGKVIAFAINLSLEVGERVYDVWRVDTAHGYLHEQKFWISHKPRPLDIADLNTAFELKKMGVKANYMRWIELFKKVRGFV